MSVTFFDISFTRRHISRRRSVKTTLRVSGKTPASAARYLIRNLRRSQPQGVFTLLRVEPSASTDTFLNYATRARKAMRKAQGERLEILRAVAKGVS